MKSKAKRPILVDPHDPIATLRHYGFRVGHYDEGFACSGRDYTGKVERWWLGRVEQLERIVAKKLAA